MKSTWKPIKSSDFGFVEDNQIYINLQKIWNSSKSNSEFLSVFSSTHVHKFLHLLIPTFLKNDIPVVWEEKAIRQLLNEEWNKKLEAQYMEDG